MAKDEKHRRWRKKRTRFGAAVGFLQEYEQKKTGTARGSVTRFTMMLVQERKRGTAHDGVSSRGQGVTGMTTYAKLPTVCSVGEFLCVSG